MWKKCWLLHPSRDEVVTILQTCSIRNGCGRCFLFLRFKSGRMCFIRCWLLDYTRSFEMFLCRFKWLLHWICDANLATLAVRLRSVRNKLHVHVNAFFNRIATSRGHVISTFIISNKIKLTQPEDSPHALQFCSLAFICV